MILVFVWLSRERPGWLIKYFDTGERAPVQNNEAARITIAYHPTTDLNITLKVQSSLNKTSGAPGEPGQWVNCPPPAPLRLPTTAAVWRYPRDPHRAERTLHRGSSRSRFQLSTFDGALTVRYSHWGHDFTSVTGFTSFHFNSRLDLNHLPSLRMTFPA